MLSTESATGYSIIIYPLHYLLSIESASGYYSIMYSIVYCVLSIHSATPVTKFI
jgi:hypothetical protein